MNVQFKEAKASFTDVTDPTQGMSIVFPITESGVNFDTVQFEARLPQNGYDTGEVDDDGKTIIATWFEVGSEGDETYPLTEAYDFQLVYRAKVTRGQHTYYSKEVRPNYGLNN
jgi:hypothetical protein